MTHSAGRAPLARMSRGVAILGATGLVGRTMLAILEQRGFPLDTLRLLASDRSPDRTLPFRGRAIAVEPVAEASFAGVDLALFACASEVSERWVGPARTAGTTVVDLSSAFRERPEVPLVVPEVNGDLLRTRPALVSNPNCSAAGIVMALAPLARAAGLERVAVVTYQSVSGAGAEALDELERGVRGGLDGAPPARRDGGPAFAFNVVPHIDRFEENGYTREEMKIVRETRKILRLPELPVSATAARVPVRVGHCASLRATLTREVTPDEARSLWGTFPGLEVVDEPARARYPTPLEAAGADAVLVGRARKGLGEERTLEFFIASDNLRKGAALNAVQIAERLSPATAEAR